MKDSCGEAKQDQLGQVWRLRRAIEGDADEVVEMVNRCYRDGLSWSDESGLIGGPRVTIEEVLHVVRREWDEIIYVLEQVQDPKSNLLGCVRVSWSAKSFVGTLDRPHGHVGMLSVSPKAQSRGIGGFLLAWAEWICSSVGLMTNMSMEVLDARRDILPWYTSKGYQVTDQWRDAAEALGAFPYAIVHKPCRFLLLIKYMDQKPSIREHIEVLETRNNVCLEVQKC
eukprot:CAMPEP_0184687864 /NCGR_PEP_ID=MMETSP0312-20130426/27801_1 /TAXON_ID=31354 /ORGANISM="Compsopogon coeruleus, Strain SAG 36.94" /LENGTH=225 /DNA_ID=CAMNT_0027144431 /DNA_START=239 /DNA_END=916 /DNA_ORIENTATION=+